MLKNTVNNYHECSNSLMSQTYEHKKRFKISVRKELKEQQHLASKKISYCSDRRNTIEESCTLSLLIPYLQHEHLHIADGVDGGEGGCLIHCPIKT